MDKTINSLDLITSVSSANRVKPLKHSKDEHNDKAQDSNRRCDSSTDNDQDQLILSKSKKQSQPNRLLVSDPIVEDETAEIHVDIRA